MCGEGARTRTQRINPFIILLADTIRAQRSVYYNEIIRPAAVPRCGGVITPPMDRSTLMKRTLVIAALALIFAAGQSVQAQYRNEGVSWGITAGAARGNNFGDDRWGMQYRGFIQVDMVPSVLALQGGLGYAELWAPGIYSASTGIIDLRLMVTPFTFQNMLPYAYGGVAASKCLNVSGSDYLPMIPFGAGLQTMLSRGTMLDLAAGFNYSLSDDLDGRTRTLAGLNPVTNQRQDGFYGFTVGLMFAF